MKKKPFVILLIAILLCSLCACGSSQHKETPDDSEMRVALITDFGEVTDQSFNQAAYEGLKEFNAQTGVKYTYYKPESDSSAEREAMIDKAIADGYNVIVLPGYAFAEAILDVTDLYPDIKFIAVEIYPEDLGGTVPANTFSTLFRSELSGYMAGYAAVRMGYTKLGFLGGMAVPGVIAFGYGYVQGIDAAAEELGIEPVVRYAYGNQFSGDPDITAVMDTWYHSGTEVVFASGGNIFTSVAEAAKKTDGKIIGVDTDQAPIIDSAYGQGMTITSAMKGVKPAIVAVLTDIINGNWDSYAGQAKELSLVSKDDMSLNYVGLPESTQWCDTFTKEDYKKLVSEIMDGTRTVSGDISADKPSASRTKIIFQGNLK